MGTDLFIPFLHFSPGVSIEYIRVADTHHQPACRVDTRRSRAQR